MVNSKTESFLKDLTLDEFDALLGTLILSTVLKDNNLSTKLMFDVTFYFCGGRYSASFSERLFPFLLDHLRFDCKEEISIRKWIS